MQTLKQFNELILQQEAGNTRIYFILKEGKETVFEFSQGTVKVLQILIFTSIK